MSISLRFAFLALLCGCCLLATASAQTTNPAPTPLTTPLAQSSYGIGMQMGQNLVQSGLDAELVDVAALMAGIQDALTAKDPQVTQEQFKVAMEQIQQFARGKLQKKMEALGEKNRRDGPVFLKKYQAGDGVKRLPGGLFVKVLKSGSGPSPASTDRVRTHYRGRFVDGSEFDSSYKGGEPAVFPVNQVIRGWTEALLKMKVGDHWQIVVPSEMAYGKEGSPPVIGPDAVLVFEIELLGIQPPQTPEAVTTPAR